MLNWIRSKDDSLLGSMQNTVLYSEYLLLFSIYFLLFLPDTWRAAQSAHLERVPQLVCDRKPC